MCVFSVVCLGSAAGVEATGGFPAVISDNDRVLWEYPGLASTYENCVVTESKEGVYRAYSVFNAGDNYFVVDFAPLFSLPRNSGTFLRFEDYLAGDKEFLREPDAGFGLIYARIINGNSYGAGISFGANNDEYIIEDASNTITGIKRSIGHWNFRALLSLSDPEKNFDLTIGAALPRYYAEETAYLLPDVNSIAASQKETFDALDVFLKLRKEIGDLYFNVDFKITSTHGTNRVTAYDGGWPTEIVKDELFYDISIKGDVLAGKIVKINDRLNCGGVLGFGFETQDKPAVDDEILDPEEKTAFRYQRAERGMLYVPVYICAEYRINDNVKISAGAGRNIFAILYNNRDSMESVDGYETNRSSWQSFISGYGGISLGTGLSLKAGNLEIELALNADALRDGPEFISGKPGNLASNLAVSFTW